MPDEDRNDPGYLYAVSFNLHHNGATDAHSYAVRAYKPGDALKIALELHTNWFHSVDVLCVQDERALKPQEEPA